jgi:ribosomal protein S18 acetylase RimI-like enzyme
MRTPPMATTRPDSGARQTVRDDRTMAPNPPASVANPPKQITVAGEVGALAATASAGDTGPARACPGTLRGMDGLATRTDALVEPAGARRRRVDAGLVVETPARRDYHGGHLLLLDTEPAPTDLPRLLARWQDELGAVPGIERIVLQWESAARAPATLDAAARPLGLELEVDEVLVHTGELDSGETDSGETDSGAVGGGHPAARPVRGDAEWTAVTTLIAGEGGTIDFWRWRVGELRALAEAGAGEWWAVVEDDEVRAATGVFWGDGLVRFQEVVTAPDHRGRGLASGLLRAVLAAHGHRGTAVIVAEADGPAARLYRRLGFAAAGYQQALEGPRP